MIDEPMESLPPLYLYELARHGITADLREQAIREIHRRNVVMQDRRDPADLTSRAEGALSWTVRVEAPAPRRRVNPDVVVGLILTVIALVVLIFLYV